MYPSQYEIINIVVLVIIRNRKTVKWKMFEKISNVFWLNEKSEDGVFINPIIK